MPGRRSFGQLAGVRPDPTRPAVVVDGLTETFRLYHERPSGLKERLYRLRRASYTEFNALDGVSFSIGHGESVGVIGANGSGKSTLLKVLAKILPPDHGVAETNGMVASLLELGAGFHGDLTGRENIYLNGAILGLTRAAIEERFDEIVEFSGVGPLLDTAVRTYSSGLYVRLGFAIAVTVDPDILLVDEVLAVGDVEFQQRSLERMQRFRDEGKTFVLVSHDLEAVEEMCERALVLDHGRVVYDGDVADAVTHYRQQVADRAVTVAGGSEDRDIVRIPSVELLADDGGPVDEVAPGARLVLQVTVEAAEDIEGCSVGMAVRCPDGGRLFETHSAWQGVAVGPLRRGERATVELRFAARLLAGVYAVRALVTDVAARQALSGVEDAVRVRVAATPGRLGVADLEVSARILQGPQQPITGADSSTERPAVEPR